MIFVTVGTHEQQFDRLLKKIDTYKENGIIEEDVFIQTGFSSYEPIYCEWKKFISYDEMILKIKKAKVVITHGGPSTFIQVLAMGKVPVVVPRKKIYNEHVNNHQSDFAKSLINNNYKILLCEDLSELDYFIKESLIEDVQFKSNNYEFNNQFENIVSNLFTDGV